jgi:septal ring factor EnvC (AmiA/AmiB activator)
MEISTLIRWLLLTCSVGLVACTPRTPIPHSEIASARTTQSIAANAGAREFAPVEFDRARRKLEQAQAALNAGDNKRARLLAEQAEIDARYAELNTRSGRLQRSITELEKGIQALREEIGGTAPTEREE